MRRREFLSLAAAPAVGLVGCQAQEHVADAPGPTSHVSAGRPNFLLVITDDQRWDALGCVQREMGDAGRFPSPATSTKAATITVHST